MTLVTGTVMDTQNTPIEGAAVLINGTIMASTDVSGHFSISGLLDGFYKVGVSHPNYVDTYNFFNLIGDEYLEIHMSRFEYWHLIPLLGVAGFFGLLLGPGVVSYVKKYGRRALPKEWI